MLFAASPSHRQIKEQRRHKTSLSNTNTGPHTEAGSAVSHSAREALDDKDDMLRNLLCPEYAPQIFTVDAAERLLKIHAVDVQLPLPFNALFNDVSQSEDLVRASSSFSKTSLF